MKKTFSLLLAIAMLATCFSQVSLAAAQNTFVAMSALCSDTYGIKLGDTKTVTFTTTIVSNRSLKSGEVSLLDENGEFVAALNDSGTSGDSVKGDGIYSVSLALTADTRTTKTYTASVGGTKTEEFEIRYYKEITDADTASLDAMWDKVEAYEDELDSFKLTDAQVMERVYTYLVNDSDVSNITRDTDYSIHFEYGDAYIPCAFVRESIASAQKGGSRYSEEKDAFDFAPAVKADGETLYYPTNENVVVYCPYYGQDSSFSYNYRDKAQTLLPITGGELDTFYGSDGNVENFKLLGNYGIAMVDSHGDLSGGKSWICVPMAGSYDTTDISEGHIQSMGGGGVEITGTFFEKYCGSMPGTVVYLGTCYGMSTEGLCAPMVRIGANFVMGYDDSVTFRYDGIMLDSVFTYLATENLEKNRLYTCEEAYTNAKNDNGQVDTWGTAVLQFMGNGATVIMSDPVHVTDVTLRPSSAELYINNTQKFIPMINPSDANRFELGFSVEDESIAAVDEAGTVTALAQGETNVVCTVTDYLDDGTTMQYIAKAPVKVLGAMSVDGISFDIDVFEANMGSAGIPLMPIISPENASNQNILFESDNEDVATVDEAGIVKPVSVGTCVIVATTEDGEFKAGVACIVNDSDFDAAANARGGKLAFINDENSPFVTDKTTDAQRASVVTTNHSNGSRSTLTLDLGLVSADTTIAFDWKISCETRYDKGMFKINGVEVSTVENISGEQDWVSCLYTVSSEKEVVVTWEYKKDSSTSMGLDCMWIDNIDVTIPNQKHKVRFMADESTLIEEMEVVHGAPAPVELIDEPYVSGKTFIAWSAMLDAIRSDLTVYPIYYNGRLTPGVVFNVTFVDWDGTVLKQTEVEEGMTAEPPADPEREGYCFIGWDVDFSAVVADMTVTALYIKIGDVNLDSEVNTGDAAYILRVVALLENEPSQFYDMVGDYNGDGTVNTGDASAILILIAQL